MFFKKRRRGGEGRAGEKETKTRLNVWANRMAPFPELREIFLWSLLALTSSLPLPPDPVGPDATPRLLDPPPPCG